MAPLTNRNAIPGWNSGADWQRGDRVAANCGSEGFLAGTVLERDPAALHTGECAGP